HAHESPFLITGPLVLLAFLSLVSGYLLARNNFVYTLLAPPAIVAHAGPSSTASGEDTSSAHASVAASEHQDVVGGEAHAEHHEAHLPHWLHLSLPFLV